MISLILLKLFTFSQILQGVPKLSHATVYIYIYIHTHTYTYMSTSVQGRFFFFFLHYFFAANSNLHRL